MPKKFTKLNKKNKKGKNLYLIEDENTELVRTTQRVVTIEELQEKKTYLRSRISEIDSDIHELQGA